MKKNSLSLVLIIFVLFSQFAFSEIEFLSPIPGVWGNKQMLVIDDIKDGDYYYSVDGSDPEQIGFAYDGPVLLDLEGPVDLKVVHCALDGTKDYGEVKYTVATNTGFNKPYEDFLFTFLDSGYYDYNIEGLLVIPPSLTFTLEDDPKNFIPGMELSIARDSVIKQFIPCTILDNETDLKWRFFIKADSQVAGIFGKREVPFEIEDWNTLKIKSDQYIYKIDSEMWGQPTEPITLDRTVPHTISWQSVSYKIGNTIESVTLPPKPSIKYEVRGDGSGSFYIDGDESYALSIISDDEDASPELFSEIGVDVFYGDRIEGEMVLGLYSDAIYQGTMDVYYTVDKLPPKSPVITSSAKTFYTRNSVDLSITVDSGAELYVAIGDPFILEDNGVIYKATSPEFYNVPVSGYNICEGNEYKTTLHSEDDKVIYYKILAYCQKGSLKSAIVEYSVIVDKSSYYFDKDAVDSLGEGTLLNPFTSFDQCIEAFKGIRSVSLKLKGDLFIDKSYQLNSNLEIINGGDCRIIFGPNGSIDINGSTLEISDCRMHKMPSREVSLIVPFFKLNHGTLVLKDCEVSADFSKNGTVIDAINSIINISSSMFSVSADSYSSFISSINSRLSIIDSSISVAGDTSVVISASSGNVNISNSKFSITGNLGRIAELFAVSAKIINNEFRAELYNKSKSVDPIFKNKKTKLVEEGNTEIGFR